MQQQALFHSNHGVVNIHSEKPQPQSPPLESKDEILKARFEPAVVENIKAFCRGRRITVSEYFRALSNLDFDYFDYISLLNKNDVRDVVVPLLDVLSKKF